MDGPSTMVADTDSPAPAVHLRFDTSPLKLGGWAAPVDKANADDELILLLMAGSTCLGKIRRDKARPDVDKHIGYSGPPAGFEVPDYGLRLFAQLSGVEDIDVFLDANGATSRHPLIGDQVQFRPLHIRHGVGKTLRLADAWLESSRGLVLRFEGGAGAAETLDAYQAMPGGPLMCVAADRQLGGHVSLADMTLINPFAPLLLVFRGEGGAIEAIDVLPFPSLVRGGLHAAERVISGHGGDDLADTATVSADLVDRWAEQLKKPGTGIATIDLDPAVHTGLEPMLNADLLAWLGNWLGISVKSSRADLPSFITEAIERHSPQGAREGHMLSLPADCIPTISSLLNSFPDDAASQLIAGGMGIVDWNRHGRIWSVWQPPSAARFRDLQPQAGQRFAPTISIEGVDGGRELALDFPLGLALREQPTRVVANGPFELPPELPSLLQLPVANRRSIDVVVMQSTSSPLPLMESLARQENIEVSRIVLCRTEGEKASRVDQAVKRLFGEHRTVPVAAGAGRIEQIVAARDHLDERTVVILDGATVLPDPRTLGTLVQISDTPGAASAGCLLRASGDRMTPLAAGYSFSQVRLDSAPAAAFATIDPAVWREPWTYPVVANTLSVLATSAAAISDLQTSGSSSSRPEVDDLLLGLHLGRQGGANLCTTLVSAYTSGPAPRSSQVATTLPYRLAPDDLARMIETCTVVQRVA